MSKDYIVVGGELYHADDYLAHYGVKGMKWGVRRAEKKAQKYERKIEAMNIPPEGRPLTKREQKIAMKYNKAQFDLVKRQNKLDKKLGIDREREREEHAAYEKAVAEVSNPGYHAQQKARRKQLTPEQSDAELDKLFKAWTNYPEYDLRKPDCYQSLKLHREVVKNVYDLQNYDRSSKEMHRLHNESLAIWDDNSANFDTKRARQEQINQQIDSQVLQELGYADTPEGRLRIRMFWEYD